MSDIPFELLLLQVKLAVVLPNATASSMEFALAVAQPTAYARTVNAVHLPLCPLCTDDLPPGGGSISCQDVLDWSKCADPWVLAGSFCNATCAQCQVHDPCWDLQPPYGSCAELQVAFKCTDPFLIKGIT
jgi:hypothetical protein